MLIREAFLLHRALFLSERACMKSVCSLPAPHALVEAAGSSVCGLSDVLGGWRGWEERGEKGRKKASILSSRRCLVLLNILGVGACCVPYLQEVDVW